MIAEFGPYQVVAMVVAIWSLLFGWMLRLLGPTRCHDVSHQSAHKPDWKPPQREIAETPKQEKSQGMDIGLSL